MEPNIPSEPRMCEKCKYMTAVAWYTKRGRMNVFCMKCGKSWEIRVPKEDREK